MDPSAPPPPPPIAQPAPRCQACGYELTGMSVEGVCPECGSRIWNPNQTPTSGAAIASLVLGCVAILSCVGFGPVSLLFGIPAVICGEIAARQVKRGERGNASAGLALAGRIMGWVGIVVGLVGVVVLIIMLLNP